MIPTSSDQVKRAADAVQAWEGARQEFRLMPEARGALIVEFAAALRGDGLHILAPIAVVAAVIPDGAGAVYAQYRAGGQAVGWNFPGGKVQPSETLEAALVREIQEECGVTVTLDRHLGTGIVRYAKGLHALHYYLTQPVARDAVREPEGHRGAWVMDSTLDSYEWLVLDRDIAELVLRRGPA